MTHDSAPSFGVTPTSADQGPAAVDGSAATAAGRGRFYLVMAIASLLVAAVLALFASAQPDGLERVAIDKGFADSAEDSPVASSPLADYSLGGEAAEASPARSAAAGVAGVALMAAVAFGVFGLLGRRSGTTDQQ